MNRIQMAITKPEDLCELIQDDLMVCLEEMPEKLKTHICEIVVQRFKAFKPITPDS